MPFNDRFRGAGAADAPQIAALHTDSWRRHYRGAYSDQFLDGNIEADRLAVWSSRLAVPSGTATVLAEDADGRLTGFVHVVLHDDPQWGSLVDNLHVVNDRRHGGLGTLLLRHAAQPVGAKPLYLWVLEQNTAARRFYRARGGDHVETTEVTGDPARLNGRPRKLRIHWPDATTLLTPAR